MTGEFRSDRCAQSLSLKGKTVIVAPYAFNLVAQQVTRLILLQAELLIAGGPQEGVLGPLLSSPSSLVLKELHPATVMPTFGSHAPAGTRIGTRKPLARR
jgi:hypothetical protein